MVFMTALMAIAAAGQCAADGVTRPLLFIIQADNDRDLVAAMAHYTSDPVFIPPTKAPVRGVSAIRQSYVEMYRDFRPHLTIDFKRASVGDRVATVSGRTGGWLEASAGGKKRAVNDEFQAVLLCDGARWQVSSLRWWPAGK